MMYAKNILHGKCKELKKYSMYFRRDSENHTDAK